MPTLTETRDNPQLSSNSVLEKMGLYSPLAWGYLGLLLFMIGDGVESGYLSPYLASSGISQENVAIVFTVYGITAAIAAWFSGALSDLWGPRRVMTVGLAVWAVFEVGFLLLGVAPMNLPMILFFYALRGFGYPLFAFGLLVWITAAAPRHRLGSAVGWFWFAFTGGLPTLGSLFASFTIPLIGPYTTLWCSLGLVVLGGAVALLGTRGVAGGARLAPAGEIPSRPSSPASASDGASRKPPSVASSASSTPRRSSDFWCSCRCSSRRRSASASPSGSAC